MFENICLYKGAWLFSFRGFLSPGPTLTCRKRRGRCTHSPECEEWKEARSHDQTELVTGLSRMTAPDFPHLSPQGDALHNGVILGPTGSRQNVCPSVRPCV